MHQIPIDFEVWKALTARLEDATDTYNEVIRRLLNLPASEAGLSVGEFDSPGLPDSLTLPSGSLNGVWFSNVFFPEGTVFRATYKGRTHRAQIRNSQWLDEFGILRTSPSDAASAISKTNVNGWRFWFVRRPHDEDWVRMDTLRP
jgi:hypothetical protein